MIDKHFILVSPGPVDGYPPVQYTARLLAESGLPVELLTTPVLKHQVAPEFRHPGVAVRNISARAAFSGNRWLRAWAFSKLLFDVRRRLRHKKIIEICYDPIGILYSDFTPSPPPRRIAHLHELIQSPDAYLERRLRKSLLNYKLVTVPDLDRARHTERILGLERLPMTIENYPMLSKETPSRDMAIIDRRFEVVYCGSLGLDQKLDEIIRSVPSWPHHADFLIIGNDTTPTANSLRHIRDDLGLQGRVRFLGWLETADAELRMSQADLGIALLDPKFEQWRTALGASNKRYQFMKAGLPQIGDMNPGVSDLLEGIGACVSSHAPEQIASLVTAYASDPKRCAEEGSVAFARHQDIYNYERVFQRLQNTIADW